MTCLSPGLKPEFAPERCDFPVAAVIAAGGDQLVGGLDVDASRVGLALFDLQAGIFEMGIAFMETHAATDRKAHGLVQVTP